MISIIVPARNNPDRTRVTLGTLLYSVNSLKLTAEFILIDDNSPVDEGILAVFRQHQVSAVGHVCKIVRAKKHQHYSGVFTEGLILSTHPLIFFISNDMMVTPTFLLAMMGVSSLDPTIGAVRGTSNYTDSHPEHMVVPPKPVKTYDEIVNFSGQVFAAKGLQYVEDQLLTGDAVLLKRAMVDKIGVLDLRFFGYFGDVDYGMRAHLAGFKLVCAKGAWLNHDGQGHVQRDIARERGASAQAHIDRRMALVETAYQEFRTKWSMDLPPRYDLVRDLQYFAMARANAAKVALKYDAPASFAGEFDAH